MKGNEVYEIILKSLLKHEKKISFFMMIILLLYFEAKHALIQGKGPLK